MHFMDAYCGIFGMATKYSEGLLAIKYRTVDKDKHALGGPFYYIERGLAEVCPGAKAGNGWANIFAVFGILAGIMGIGTITQINGITSAANNVLSRPRFCLKSANVILHWLL